ncbi:MAG: hypothetical protein KatS3mg077_1499 [Candidatus Binatia bacterium]|nr:MAG: hypothetical protein KatS3mg077_1499 [Candidatus Binatia bacterium]
MLLQWPEARPPRPPAKGQLQTVTAIHEKNLRDGRRCIQMPAALERKYPSAVREWRWHWVFPEADGWITPEIGPQRRHYVDECIVQKAATHAARQAGLGKGGECPYFPSLLCDASAP